MAKRKRPVPTLWEVSDELWERIEPLLKRLDPPAPTGRRRTDRRRVLDGIIFRLRTGCQLAGQVSAVALFPWRNETSLDQSMLQQVRQPFAVLHIGLAPGHTLDVVALPEFARKVLVKHLSEREVRSPYVFCTSKGTPFGPRNVVRHFKKVLKKAGLPQTTRLHDLRHTFVSFMLAENVPPSDVQKIAGHASFSTTVDIYGHLMVGAHKEAAAKLDKLFTSKVHHTQ